LWSKKIARWKYNNKNSGNHTFRNSSRRTRNTTKCPVTAKMSLRNSRLYLVRFRVTPKQEGDRNFLHNFTKNTGAAYLSFHPTCLFSFPVVSQGGCTSARNVSEISFREMKERTISKSSTKLLRCCPQIKFSTIVCNDL